MDDFSNASSGSLYNSLCSLNATIGKMFNATPFNITATGCINLSQAETPPQKSGAVFLQASYISSFIIIAIAFVTILGNVLLLFVFLVDPLRIFRTPTSVFLIALSVADTITAITGEPFNATCFLMVYYSYPEVRAICSPLFDVGQRISHTTFNISFFTVLQFTVAQLIAICSPLNYGRKITKLKVLICIVLTWLYCIGFTCLFLITDQDTHMMLSKIDLFLHSICSIIIMTLCYGFLYVVFRRKMAKGVSLRNEDTAKRLNNVSVTNRIQRNFVILNFVLIVVLYLCSIPSIVVWILIHYRHHGQTTPYLMTAQLMADVMLYLKFMLDPIIYAWRLPRYRETLIFMIRRKTTHKMSDIRSRQSLANSVSNVSLSNLEPKESKMAKNLSGYDGIDISTSARRSHPIAKGYTTTAAAPRCGEESILFSETLAIQSRYGETRL